MMMMMTCFPKDYYFTFQRNQKKSRTRILMKTGSKPEVFESVLHIICLFQWILITAEKPQ